VTRTVATLPESPEPRSNTAEEGDSTEPKTAVVCGSTGLAMQLSRLLRDVGCPVRVLAPDLSTAKATELRGIGVTVMPDFDYRVFPWDTAAGLSDALGVALVDEDDAANVNTAFKVSSACGVNNQCIPIALRVKNEAVARRVEAALPHCIALSVSSVGARAFVQRALADEGRRPRASSLHRPVPALADPSDTVTYVQSKALVFRSPRRLPVRGDHIADITMIDGSVAISAPGSPDRVLEVLDAGQAKLWRGRAHWTWLAWLRWHLRRTLGAPASVVRKTAGSSVFLRLAVVAALTFGVAATEGAVQHKPLLQLLSLPSLILSCLSTLFVSDRGHGPRVPRARLRRRQLELSEWIQSTNRRLVPNEGRRRAYLLSACAFLVAALVVTLSLFHAPLWIRAASATATIAELASRWPTVRSRYRLSLVLALFGLPLLSAAAASGLGASRAAATITGVTIAFFVATVRFGDRVFRWLDRRRSLALVFGVGTVGSEVIRRLVDQGVSVIAADRDPSCPHVAAMRRLGVAVEAGYESIDQVLDLMRADRAKVLFAVTDDDVANIECAIRLQEAREDRARWADGAEAPGRVDLTVLVRAYQVELARILHSADGWDVQTVSALVAVAFAKALAGEKLYGEICVGSPQASSNTVVVAEISLDGGSELSEYTIVNRRLCAPGSRTSELGGLVLMVVRQRAPWCEESSTISEPLHEHDRVVVLATRDQADAIRHAAMGNRRPLAAADLILGIRKIEHAWVNEGGSLSVDLAGVSVESATEGALVASASSASQNRG